MTAEEQPFFTLLLLDSQTVALESKSFCQRVSDTVYTDVQASNYLILELVSLLVLLTRLIFSSHKIHPFLLVL